MATKKQEEQLLRADEELREKLPPGVKLLRTLEGHKGAVFSVAFDPAGRSLASGSADGRIKLWEVSSGNLLRTLEGHKNNAVYCVAFYPEGHTLASGSDDETVKLWEATSGRLLRTIEGHKQWVLGVAVDPKGHRLASGSVDRTGKLWDATSGRLLCTLEGHQAAIISVAIDPEGRMVATGGHDLTVKLWDATSGNLLHTLKGHQNGIYSVAFDPVGRTLASGSYDQTVKLWDVSNRMLLRTLEGHTGFVDIVAFSPDGRLLASRSNDGTIRLWSCQTWETVAVIPEPTISDWRIPTLAFHPTLPLLATAGSEPDTPERERCRLIHLWELDFDVLLGKRAGVAAAARAVHHTTGKIVLVGDHSVGKSALGYRQSQRRAAEQRTRFEQAVFRVRAYMAEQNIQPPECFISYAWGVPEHERWVEKRLATDLQKAGIDVVLDRWHNAQIGASVARFVERIEKSDRIVMVGTPLYRRKYENKETSTGYVVAAEVDVIANRLLGTETQKASVLPLLLDGEKTASLPPLLHGRVYADFRDEVAYFTTAFDLILSLYQLPPNHPAVADLRESLRGPEMR